MTSAAAESWLLLVIGMGFMQASPGPAVLTLVGYTFEFGRALAASLFAAFVLGQFTALVVGVMGFALILSSAPEVIGVLRFSGGCLLVYVGFTTLLNKRNKTLQPALKSLKEIGHSPILSIEEEQHYTRLAQNGDENARAIMIECKLPLVAKVARQYMNKGLTQLDLINASYIALNHSIENFDPAGGITFSSYSAWMIKQSLEFELMIQAHTIRPSTTGDIAAAKPLAVNKLRRGSGDKRISVDKSFGDLTSVDTIIQPDTKSDPTWKLHNDSNHSQINDWLISLEPKHRNIITNQFGLHDYLRLGKDVGRRSILRMRSSCHAVGNTWFIAASSPIAIVFYTAVFPDFIGVNGLDQRSFIFLGSMVLGISSATGACYIFATSVTRRMLVSSSVGQCMRNLANVVLILAGVWAITSAFA